MAMLNNQRVKANMGQKSGQETWGTDLSLISSPGFQESTEPKQIGSSWNRKMLGNNPNAMVSTPNFGASQNDPTRCICGEQDEKSSILYNRYIYWYHFNPMTSMIPSGNLTVCYWKWPSRNSWFTHWKWWIFPSFLVCLPEGIFRSEWGTSAQPSTRLSADPR